MSDFDKDAALEVLKRDLFEDTRILVDLREQLGRALEHLDELEALSPDHCYRCERPCKYAGEDPSNGAQRCGTCLYELALDRIDELEAEKDAATVERFSEFLGLVSGSKHGTAVDRLADKVRLQATVIEAVRAWRDRKRNRALPGHEDVSIIQLEDAIWKALDELERVNTDTESPQEALSNQS